MPAPDGIARPAAVVNAEIRELAGRSVLTDDERQQLAELWAEWQLADQAEDHGRA
jgi:hypothetical protein